MHKVVRGTLKGLVAAVGLLIGLFLLSYAVLGIIGAASYGEARKLRQYVCKIPDLGSGFAPQGITYSAERDLYIHTGYDVKHNVCLYVGKDKSFRKVPLIDEEGNTLAGHAGGVTVTRDCVYIAARNALLLFDLNDLVESTEPVQVRRTIPVDNNAAYCYSDDEYLYVGEFYRAGNYETEESHHFTTPSGEENRAIYSCYKLDSTGLLVRLPLLQPHPLYTVSVTGLVQGMAAVGDTVILSRSYGLKNSKLDYHTLPSVPSGMITPKFALNTDALELPVPLYALDSTTLTKSLTLPAFSEDLTVVGDRVVVTNEASANRYFIGKLFGANKVYSFPIFNR